MREEWWILYVQILFDDQTGARQIRAYCYDDRHPPEFSRDPTSPFLPITALTVQLRPLLLSIMERAYPEKRAFDA